MAEILTESFCERCGTRYTFESAARRTSPLGVLGTVGRGIRNFVAMPDASLDEAFAVARAETEQGATAHQLEAFHRTFNFCLSCRQYTCAECWNAVEGRCLSCAPVPEAETRADLAEASESLTIATAGVTPPAFAAGPADLAWPVIDAARAPGTIELPASPTESGDEAEPVDDVVEPSPWEAPVSVVETDVEAEDDAQVEAEIDADQLAEREAAVAAAHEAAPAELESPELAFEPDVAEAEDAAEPADEPAPAVEEPGVRPDLGSLLAAGAALGPMVAEALEPEADATDEPEESGGPVPDDVAPEPGPPASDERRPARPATFPGFEPGANLDAEIEAYDLRVAAVSQPLPPRAPAETLAPAARVAEPPPDGAPDVTSRPAPFVAPPPPAAARPAPVPESARLVERFVAASPGQRAVRSEAIPEVPAADPATAVPAAPVGTCPSCGLTLSASARFCRRCGTAQHA